MTIGSESTSPTVTVSKSTEGIEATVVNIAGGTVEVTSSDDGVNAANSDGTYASLGYSINMTGGSLTVSAPRADGLDSNGNINLIAGSATISSASNGGDAGLDYDGQLYVSDSFRLDNQSGVASMGGGMMDGGMMGGGMRQNGRQQGSAAQTPTQDGQMPTQDGQMPTQGMNRSAQPGGMAGGFGGRMGGPGMGGQPYGGFGGFGGRMVR